MAGSGAAASVVEILTDTTPDGLRSAILADILAAIRVVPMAARLEIIETDDLLVQRPVGVPGFGQVARARIAVDEAERRIGDVFRWFTEHAVPFEWWVAPGDEPVDLSARLEDRGIPLTEDIAAMALDLARLVEFTPADNVDVVAVVDESGLERYVDLVVRGEVHPQGISDESRDAMIDGLRASVLAEGFAPHGVPSRWIGRLDGADAGTGRLFMASGAAAVYAMTTLPSARRRGVATAVLSTLLRAARDAGYRVAVLTATDLGAPVYRKAGFEEFFRVRVHAWAPPSGGGSG